MWVGTDVKPTATGTAQWCVSYSFQRGEAVALDPQILPSPLVTPISKHLGLREGGRVGSASNSRESHQHTAVDHLWKP